MHILVVLAFSLLIFGSLGYSMGDFSIPAQEIKPRVPESLDKEWLRLVALDIASLSTSVADEARWEEITIKDFSTDRAGGWDISGKLIDRIEGQTESYLLYQRQNFRWDYQKGLFAFDNELNFQSSYVEYFVLKLTKSNVSSMEVIGRYVAYPAHYRKSILKPNFSATFNQKADSLIFELKSANTLIKNTTINIE